VSSEIDIVDLKGAGFARGELYGNLRQSQIERFLNDWLGSLGAAGVGDPQGYLSQMLEATRYLNAIDEHSPELLEDVRGIAAGAGVPFDLVLASQLMDEEWAYRVHFLQAPEAPPKCSSVAIHPRDGLTWIGQNMDLGSYTNGHLVLIRAAPEGQVPGALIFTIGSMIGLLGVNSRGLAVCVNALPQLPAVWQGLPVAFVIRRLLTAEDVTEAAQILHAIPHATGQHYLIADSHSIRSFEASPAAVLEYHSPNPTRILRTNHPLVGNPARAFPESINSTARLRSLTARLMDGELDLETVKAALSSCDDADNPVSRALYGGHASQGPTFFTTGSMVSALQQDSAIVDSWVSAGPPHLSPYARVQLQKT
jgi:isopenicillin-N N-acyltransferase-like protein